MIDSKIRGQYQATIGIECHVQLKTITKLFAAVGNDAREAPPNSLVSHICFGLPGALPVLNSEAVHLAVRAAFALDIKPQKFSKFDRKHYFYPDLPKGYQITQYEQPIILGGVVSIIVAEGERRIGITRAHLEEDAGKSTHPVGTNYSSVDLNRAGTPLLEIVSEPDMHSAAEAKAFAKELYLRMKYADVSDANLYYGNMRFDVNVSVSKDITKLGTRSETKNLNSFRSVEKAVEYEIDRQIELLEKGQSIVQETRGWNDAKQKTFSQRTKEDAHDYRYFPEPDIPPVVLDDTYIEQIRHEMPIMPKEWRTRLEALGLDRSQTDTLLEAEVESPTVNYLALIEDNLIDKEFAKQLANWFVNLEIPLRHTREKELDLKNDGRLKLYKDTFKLLRANKLSSTTAKAILHKYLQEGETPPDLEIQVSNLIQVSDEGAIVETVKKVLEENKKATNDLKNGEMKALGFLVGQVMKQTQGRANPSVAHELIKKQLSL